METLEERFPFLFNKQADYNTNSPSYYDGLAKHNKVLQILAKMIEDYDLKLTDSLGTINTTLTAYIATLDGKLNGFDQSVIDLLTGWIQDGSMIDIIGLALLDRDRVYASQFGIKNDDTDTTTEIMEALAFCKIHAKTLYLPVGNYRIIGDHVLPGCSMIGEEGGTVTVTIVGNSYFDTNGLDAISVENIDFKLYDNYLSDSTDKSSKKELFYGTVNKKRFNYRNLSFIGDVPSTNGTFRYKGGIRDGCAVGGLIENLSFENMAAGVIIAVGSKNYAVKKLEALNFETLVYSRGSFYDIEGITGTNTLTQMMIWLQKNHLTNPVTQHNGLDLVLCEGNNYNLKDLKGVNCIERVIYSQGSFVTAENLWGSNCDGFKFVGVSKDDISTNINISNTWFEVNTDLVALGRTKVNEFTFYWAKNITVENTISSDGTASGTNPIRSIVYVYRYVKNLTLKNMFSTYTENSFLYVGLQITSEFKAAYPSPTDENYMVLDTCMIDNCSVKKNNRRNGSLLSVRITDSNATILTKYGLRNITIKESKVEYGAVKDDYIYEWAYCDGFLGIENRQNTGGYWNSGLPNVAQAKANNIVLRESNILFSNLDNLFTQLGIIALTKGSELIFKTALADRTYQIKITVDNNTQLTTPVLINQGSRVECDLFLNGLYLSSANFPINSLIEYTDNAGGYHLQKVNAGVATTLIGTSFVANTFQAVGPTMVIRGDQKTVPFNVKIKTMLGS